MRSILLSVPTRGQIQWATVTRLDEIRDKGFLDPILYQPGNLSVAQTRNKIVQKFLAGDWEALAMVDDDIVPPPYFLELAERLDEFALIASPHPMPHPRNPGEVILTAFDYGWDGLSPAEIDLDGYAECGAVATGAVIIRRDVLEQIKFRITDDPTETVTSDDFAFCENLRNAGFRIGYEIRGGWFSDHHSTVSLAPLIENRLVKS